jgi:hypothetical protein
MFELAILELQRVAQETQHRELAILDRAALVVRQVSVTSDKVALVVKQVTVNQL